MSDVVTRPIMSCPADINGHIWQFLDERSLARCEAVCTGWRAQIASPDQHVWRTFCQTTKGYIFPTREELSDELEFFDARVVDLIFGYADENYKKLATIIYGTVVLSNHFIYLRLPPKDGSIVAERPWGRSEREPFIFVEIFREKSWELASRKWKEGDADAYEGGTWDDFFQIQKHARCFIPTRLFYNHDGRVKNHGDELRVVIDGKRVQLECTFDEYMKTCGDREFQTYAEAFTYRVDFTLRNFTWISQSDISSSRDAAMADPRDWIPHDMS